MLFHSTHPGNIKRQNIKVKIGKVSIEEYREAKHLKEMFDKGQKLGVEVKFYLETEETDEFGHTEDFLVFFYERTETDEEYKDRMDNLEFEDMKDFLSLLGKWHHALRNKAAIKKVWDRVVTNGKYRHLAPDWQEPQVAEFFSEDSVESKIQAAVAEERERWEKERKELKKRIEAALKGCL